MMWLQSSSSWETHQHLLACPNQMNHTVCQISSAVPQLMFWMLSAPYR